MKFVIDRKTWRRGGENRDLVELFGGTYLLNGRGYMCCLGQIARQCEVPNEDIMNWTQPNHVPLENTLYHSLLTIEGENNNLAVDAMYINDDSCISDAEREQQLIVLFSKHGHELEFTNEICN